MPKRKQISAKHNDKNYDNDDDDDDNNDNMAKDKVM